MDPERTRTPSDTSQPEQISKKWLDCRVNERGLARIVVLRRKGSPTVMAAHQNPCLEIARIANPNEVSVLSQRRSLTINQIPIHTSKFDLLLFLVPERESQRKGSRQRTP